jgi:hypothetical protein
VVDALSPVYQSCAYGFEGYATVRQVRFAVQDPAMPTESYVSTGASKPLIDEQANYQLLFADC